MLGELLTPDRLELVAQACTELSALLDRLPNEDTIHALRETALRGLELARAAIAALDDDGLGVEALRKIIDRFPD